MTVFDRVKKLAKKSGLSISKVEDQAGIGANSLYNWRTKVPSSENVAKVAKVLHTTTDYLLGLSDDPSVKDEGLTNNQKRVAYSIDPDISDEEREAIISMVKEAMKLRRRL